MTEHYFDSPNFQFLHEHDSTLVLYAARAERYVFDDPNTSLIKLRQFAEWLARHVAARYAIDTTGEDFRKILSDLRCRQIGNRDILEFFDLIRLRGNEAIHEGHNDRQSALQGLISAQKLAIWFHRAFRDRDFDPGPFRPPPDPRDAEASLRQELSILRDKASDYQAAIEEAAGNVTQLSQVRVKLERQLLEQYEALCRAEAQVEVTEKKRADLEQKLNSVLRQAESQPAEAIQSLLERTEMAASFIGHSRAEYLPVAQVRHFGPRKSRCCKTLMLLAGRQDGNVLCYCMKCGNDEPLRFFEFRALEITLECPVCHECLAPTDKIRVNRFGRSRSGDYLPKRVRYGYRCDECGWECLFSAILPDEENLHPPYRVQD